MTVDEVVPGLKAAISAAFPEKETGKVLLSSVLLNVQTRLSEHLKYS